MAMEKHGILKSYTNHIRYTVRPRSGHYWSKLLHPSIYCRKSTQCKGTSLMYGPNHEELLAIYDQPCTISTFQELQEVISPLIHHLLDVVGVAQSGGGAVVVRCGRHGSCVGTKSKGIRWFPAFFTEKDSARVVDVSGGMSSRATGGNSANRSAGNSYLGGYAAGLHLTGGDPYEGQSYHYERSGADE